ncbi:chromosomal replication initiator protein DnaA [Hyphobacterium sp. HN65]|uniref:Chromosomal replication initiator protein DnaA n=1 Tax=Hyphobacterium lacteum TaxID=3116575 RepID=A0ABU7LS23_9PROT|nr:chromosomal replication initiator protein DnaA [Hyphobacterium sp. HN65]MEE2526730.1 chromosomal replication initiator protein DnaA [Hyphobacterium sp. HN65]
MTAPGGVWREVRAHLRREYGETVFSSNMARLRVREEADGGLTVIAPNRFYRDWVDDHAGARLRALWAQHDPTGRAIRLVAEEDLAPAGPVAAKPALVGPAADPSANDAEVRAVNERFTFDTFMVGPSNEMASAAARSILNASPSPFNPVFFYGDYGVGKTHLLNAIAHSVELGQSRRKSLYLTAEEFLSGFVSAMRKKDTISFKESVRRVDVLLIDDVHFIAGKPKTEDEFLHTVASLIADEKQVILASHKAPADLNVSDPRLASLLKGGFACELRKPDLDLRRKILDCKIAQASTHYPELHVPETVRDFLAARMTASARELEGVLNNVIGRTALLGRPVTMEAVEAALRELSIVSERRVTVDLIQKTVADRFGVKVSDILSKRRTKTVVKPRHVAMYLAKTMTTRSLPDIGRRFGDRDHSTVIHAVNKITDMIAAGDPVKDEIESLSREIRG